MEAVFAASGAVHECYTKHWVEYAFGRPEVMIDEALIAESTMESNIWREIVFANASGLDVSKPSAIVFAPEDEPTSLLPGGASVALLAFDDGLAATRAVA